jgi:hypothetical protein
LLDFLPLIRLCLLTRLLPFFISTSRLNLLA